MKFLSELQAAPVEKFDNRSLVSSNFISHYQCNLICYSKTTLYCYCIWFTTCCYTLSVCKTWTLYWMTLCRLGDNRISKWRFFEIGGVKPSSKINVGLIHFKVKKKGEETHTHNDFYHKLYIHSVVGIILYTEST